MRELIKLALAVGARLEGGVHSHVRRALDTGATASELRHVVTLAVPTLGFPNAAAAFTWIEDVLAASKHEGAHRSLRRANRRPPMGT